MVYKATWSSVDATKESSVRGWILNHANTSILIPSKIEKIEMLQLCQNHYGEPRKTKAKWYKVSPKNKKKNNNNKKQKKLIDYVLTAYQRDQIQKSDTLTWVH